MTKIDFEFDLQQSKDPNFDILLICMSACTGTTNLYIYCFCGEMATGSFAQMTNALFEANWPRLHPRLQKYVLLMLANMQQPIYYNGFGIVVLELNTFYAVNWENN